MNNQIKVLFLTDDREDYLADGILHGLRQLDGIIVTDYPRKECLYRAKLTNRGDIRGGGFTLYGLLSEPLYPISRCHIQQKLESNYFDIVIISNIWRQWGIMLQWSHLLSSQCKLAILDGDDDERFYPSSTTKARQFGFTNWLKRLMDQKNTTYFKREWTKNTNSWPYKTKLKQLGFSIPSEKILRSSTKKTRLFPCHIVDPEVAELANAQTTYAFSVEDDYRKNLAESRFGITLRRGGWECLRHYEIAASGTIPCFRDLILKPSTCAPHGLIDGVNCISYRNAIDLMKSINQLSRQKEEKMQAAAREWAKESSTKLRAIELLHSMDIYQ